MPVKRRHTEAEITALAERFRESWREGNVMRSWLRAHADELRHLVQHEDWSWANLGKALMAAGIIYRTGKPWTGENLRRGVVLACRPLKGRQGKNAGQEQAANRNSGTTVQRRQEDGEPEFRIIRRRDGEVPQPLAPVRASPRPDLSEAEIQAIAAGLPLKR